MVEACEASERGGGLLVGYDARVAITRSEFSHNNALLGGAVFVEEGARVTIADSVFDSNSAGMKHRKGGGGGGLLFSFWLADHDHVIHPPTASEKISAVFRSTTGRGGAIFCQAADAFDLGPGVTLTANTADLGAKMVDSNSHSIMLCDRVCAPSGW